MPLTNKEKDRRILVAIFLTGMLWVTTVGGVLAYDNLQTRTPILGLRFENARVTGMGHAQIQQVVAEKAASQDKPLFFTQDNTLFRITPADIKYQVQPAYLTNQILLTGRQGSIWQKLSTQFKALLGLENQRLSGQYSNALLFVKLAEMKDAYDRPALPARPNFAGNALEVLPAAVGRKVKADQVVALVAQNIAHPPLKPLSIPTTMTNPPPTTKEDVNRLREEAAARTARPLTFTANNLQFVLTPTDLRNLLTVESKADPNHPGETTLVLRLDSAQLHRKIGDFAQKVSGLAGGEFDDTAAEIALYSQFYSGQRFAEDVSVANSPLAESSDDSSTHIAAGMTSRRVLGAETNAVQANGAAVTPKNKVAYLTFDDGPNTEYHPLILDILQAYHVRATFFLIGENTQRNMSVAQDTVDDGNVIGNHSWSHAFLPKLSNKAVYDELQKTNVVLQPINHDRAIQLFRPPYGGINAQIRTTAQSLGLHTFLWDVDPTDWANPTVDELVNRVVHHVHDGADILLHSNHLVTVRALPKMIEQLQAEGYTFQTLDKSF